MSSGGLSLIGPAWAAPSKKARSRVARFIAGNEWGVRRRNNSLITLKPQQWNGLLTQFFVALLYHEGNARATPVLAAFQLTRLHVQILESIQITEMHGIWKLSSQLFMVQRVFCSRKWIARSIFCNDNAHCNFMCARFNHAALHRWWECGRRGSESSCSSTGISKRIFRKGSDQKSADVSSIISR